MTKLQAGNAGLFFLIKIINLIFGVLAITLIGLGIWLSTEFMKFSIIEMVFIGLGLLEFLLVLLVFSARNSVLKLRCYLFAMFILFICLLTSVIVVFATGEKIITQITDNQQVIDLLKKYLNIVNIYCAAQLVVMLIQMLLTYCYIGSLRSSNNEFDYKFLDDDGQALTLAEKSAKDKQAISEKYAKKKEQMMLKHEGYKDYMASKN